MSNFIVFIAIEVALISSMESQRKANWGKFMEKCLTVHWALCSLWWISNGKNPMGADSHEIWVFASFLLFVQKKTFWIKQVFYLYIFKGLGWVGFGCFLGVFCLFGVFYLFRKKTRSSNITFNESILFIYFFKRVFLGGWVCVWVFGGLFGLFLMDTVWWCWSWVLSKQNLRQVNIHTFRAPFPCPEF